MIDNKENTQCIYENANVLGETLHKSYVKVHYQACWIPWFGDSWGASINVYE
ncbi:MAG: hypothetical protein FWF56_03710 [Firmicutes bacterium]|nr:hypothetical protein [Bacillota bacterium]MCL1953873.1 hypothetical protein [Bacillota bacterium]